jgi:Domain of unknown function (DUF4190)
MTDDSGWWSTPRQAETGETNPTKPIPQVHSTKPIPQLYGPDPWQQDRGHDPAPAAYASYGYPRQKTNGMAVASLVLSISALFCGLPAILGIICGHVALGQINRRGEHGRGLAIAGLVIGYVFVVLFLVFVVIVVLLSAANTNAAA